MTNQPNAVTKEELADWINERLGLVYLGLTQLADCPGYWETYYEDEIEPLESIFALISSAPDAKNGPTVEYSNNLIVIPIPGTDLFLAALRQAGAAVYKSNKDGTPKGKVCSIEWHPHTDVDLLAPPAPPVRATKEELRDVIESCQYGLLSWRVGVIAEWLSEKGVVVEEGEGKP